MNLLPHYYSSLHLEVVEEEEGDLPNKHNSRCPDKDVSHTQLRKEENTKLTDPAKLTCSEKPTYTVCNVEVSWASLK